MWHRVPLCFNVLYVRKYRSTALLWTRHWEVGRSACIQGDTLYRRCSLGESVVRKSFHMKYLEVQDRRSHNIANLDSDRCVPFVSFLFLSASYTKASCLPKLFWLFSYVSEKGVNSFRVTYSWVSMTYCHPYPAPFFFYKINRTHWQQVFGKGYFVSLYRCWCGFDVFVDFAGGKEDCTIYLTHGSQITPTPQCPK